MIVRTGSMALVVEDVAVAQVHEPQDGLLGERDRKNAAVAVGERSSDRRADCPEACRNRPCRRG